MEQRLQQQSVIATIRGMVDDNVAFTSSELRDEFTLAEVARRLGTSRSAVRRVFNTVAEAANAVRLRKMDELLAGWGTAGRVGLEPSERFRSLCDRLVEYEVYQFFVDSRPVFQVFEDRIRAEFVAIVRDGVAHGSFEVGNVEGAAQFAFDVMRGMAVEANANNEDMDSLSIDDGSVPWTSKYEHHLSLILRSWGWCASH